jgi:hypothetical protein
MGSDKEEEEEKARSIGSSGGIIILKVWRVIQKMTNIF